MIQTTSYTTTRLAMSSMLDPDSYFQEYSIKTTCTNMHTTLNQNHWPASK